MFFLNNGFIYYILFSDYLLVWRSFEIVLVGIYADKNQIKREFDDKLAY